MRWHFFWAARQEQKSLDTNGSRASRAWKPSLPTRWFLARRRKLFAGAYQKVEKKILNRAQLLTRKLNRATPTPTAARKLQILEAITSGSGIESNKTNDRVSQERHQGTYG